MITAIIVAAGMGSRMNLGYNKQYLKLFNKEILVYTLEAFQNVDEIDNIILVTHEDEIGFCTENIVKKYSIDKVSKIVSGATTRQGSVYNGLKACENSHLVLIHDGARPFIKEEVIKESIKFGIEKGAATVAVKVKDTIKFGKDGAFTGTLNRDELYSIQTPQTFRYELILKAHNFAIENGYNGTDDASLLENLGEKVYIVNGDYFNIKITTKEDIYIGNGILTAFKEGM